MRITLLVGAAALLLTTVGLTTAATQQSQPQHDVNMSHHDMNMSMMQNCPMKVPGTGVSVTDTENGIALTLTTKSGDVAELRRRIENMAKMHGTAPNAPMHGNMTPFSVKYEEIASGARLTLTPDNSGQLDSFRTAVRQHAEQMNKGECSMMQGMMNGMKKPGASSEDHSAHH